MWITMNSVVKINTTWQPPQGGVRPRNKMPTTIKTEQEFIDEWKEFDKQVINKFNYTDEQYKQFYQKYLEKVKI